MPFTVKQADIQDLDAIAILFNEYRMFYKQESDLKGARSFLFDRFEHMESIIFAARDNESDALIGFTQLYPSFSSVSMKRSLILNDLYVRESFRNQGAAALLLDAAKSYALQIGAKGIGLATAIDNASAQRLYEKNGYTRVLDFYQYSMALR